jgi:hypothetical protein
MLRAIHITIAALGLGTLAMYTTGCVTEPDGTVLTGQFGGANIGLIATDTAAHFEFLCGGAVTEPLRFDADGTAHASGATWSVGAGPSVDIIVEARPVHVTLQVTIRFGAGEPRSYVLGRYMAPKFENVMCLASTVRQSTGMG